MNLLLPATQNAENGIQLNPGYDAYDDLQPVRGTILVVEDEAFVREAACDILEDEGYRVLRAANAAEAQEAFRRRGSVQLLLSDVVLPGQSGLELAKSLRAVRPPLKVIFISGYPENTVTRSGLATGQMSYLPKPFSAESLLARVRQVLESQEEPVGP